MPAWGEILREIGQAAQLGPQLGGASPWDFVRRKYIIQLQQLRGRAIILYATKWTQAGGAASPDMVSITDEDLQALMTVMNGVTEPKLDLILHSPGGSIEAAEALVTYLRSKFSDICVIVPQQAMSAATMLSCAADTIVLGKHSFLGPTDPQFILQTEVGARFVTAQNIEDQFARAQKECADPTKIGAWLPILKQYGPDLLQKCANATKLSRSLVAEWLAKYMLKGTPGSKKKADEIADWISSHKHFQTHGRHLSREDLRAKGFTNILNLEDVPGLQDPVLSAFHATTITFDATPAVKLVENHLGKAFIKMMQMPQMMIPQQLMQAPRPAQPPQPAQPPATPQPQLPAPDPKRSTPQNSDLPTTGI